MVGDCLSILSTFRQDSIDTCITDPPYGLSFMGQSWDYGVPGVTYWSEVLRVLKPGGALLAFGGTRTHHRLMCAIEDAGFELRDCLMWMYGTGFPKSHNISKAIDKAAGAERKVVGQNPNARPNHDGVRVWIGDKKGKEQSHPPLTAPATDEARIWDGRGTALKPAWEPIILAMKPLDGTFAANALKHGVAGLNIGGCRVGHGERWPANVMLDEEAGKLLDEQTGTLHSHGGGTSKGMGYHGANGVREIVAPDKSGGASRFFYCAKASKSERTANKTVENRHPTVKPLALMRWLARLTASPTGGMVLDPFAGSGSTGIAAVQEGLDFIGVELHPEHADIARERLRLACDEMREVEPLFHGID